MGKGMLPLRRERSVAVRTLALRLHSIVSAWLLSLRTRRPSPGQPPSLPSARAAAARTGTAPAGWISPSGSGRDRRSRHPASIRPWCWITGSLAPGAGVRGQIGRKVR